MRLQSRAAFVIVLLLMSLLNSLTDSHPGPEPSDAKSELTHISEKSQEEDPSTQEGKAEDEEINPEPIPKKEVPFFILQLRKYTNMPEFPS
jgi:hypothetical protein